MTKVLNVFLLIAAVLLTACGSTVEMQGAGGDGVGNDLGMPRPGGDGRADTANGSAPGEAATVPGSGSSVTPTGLGTQAGGGEGQVDSGPPRTGTGRPSRPAVEVGIAYTTNVESFGSAFGSSFDTGDQRKQAEAIVNYLNRNGGLGGHRVIPVWFPVDLTSSQPYEQTSQQICSSWTEDHKVVAGLFVAANVPVSLADCLSRKQVLYVNSGFFPHDTADFQRASFMVNPDELAVDVASRSYVDGLVAAGFLRTGDKIGLLRYDIPAVKRATAQHLKPALTRHGLKLEVEFEVHFPDSTPGIASSAAPVQSAVLQMRSAGVNKILMLCAGCASFFMQAAESQNYRPKYGLSSADRPVILAPQVPAEQLAGAQGIGWIPLNDVPMNQAPARSTNGRLCDAILEPTGQATRQGPRFVGSSYCEALLFMAAAAGGATAVTGAGLRDSAVRLGSSYASVNAFRTVFAPNRHFGVASYRSFRFKPGCTCFEYAGPERRIP